MKGIDWVNHILNFVAVIVGVFLAFYISDVAEHKKEQKQLSHIINIIIEDLKEDQATFEDYHIPINETQLNTIEKLIYGVITENEDTISTYFDLAISVENFYPSSATFNSLKSTGKLDLIENLEVKTALSDYYDTLGEEAKAKGLLQSDFLLDRILPWITKNTDLINGDLSSMKGNIEIANLFALYSSFIANKTENYKDIARVSKDLEDLISETYNL